MTATAVLTKVSSFDLSKAIIQNKFFSKIKMSPTARLVLITLCSYHNPTKAYSFPRQKTLSESTGASLKSVTNAINELRALGLLMTTGNIGDTLKYHFTAKFFEAVKITNPCVKVTHEGCVKTADHEQINLKQINKKPGFNNFNFVQGMNYKTPEATRGEIQASLKKDSKTPFNDKETALKYIETLLDSPQNWFIDSEILRIKKLWQINNNEFLIESLNATLEINKKMI